MDTLAFELIDLHVTVLKFHIIIKKNPYMLICFVTKEKDLKLI